MDQETHASAGIVRHVPSGRISPNLPIAYSVERPALSYVPSSSRSWNVELAWWTTDFALPAPGFTCSALMQRSSARSVGIIGEYHMSFPAAGTSIPGVPITRSGGPNSAAILHSSALASWIGGGRFAGSPSAAP